MPIQQPKVNKINIELDEMKRTISFNFIAMKTQYQLNCKLIREGIYTYSLKEDDVEVFTFDDEKPINQIGKTKNCTVYKSLIENLELHDIYPDSPLPVNERILDFVKNVRTVFFSQREKLDLVIEGWLIQDVDENRLTYFLPEKFSIDEKKAAKTLLMKNNVIEKIYKLISYKVVGQKSSCLLSFCAAISSAYFQPLHNIATGGPASGKSRVMDTIFDIFPENRKIELYPDTTHNFLLRMTHWKEGNEFFKNKLISLDDLGSESEQKKAAELLSVFKILMSKGMYKKGVADPDEKGKSIEGKILELDGCGAVFVQMILLDPEAQFGSRAIIWSPRDSANIRNQVKEYQEDELKTEFKTRAFERKRPVVAHAIDVIFRFTDNLENDNTTFRIYNPFTSHCNDLLNVDKSPNANRDRTMVQTIPKMVTLTNCFNRELYYNSDIGQYALVVTPEDYFYTLKEIGTSLSSFIEKKSDALLRYAEIIQENFMPSSYEVTTLKKYSEDKLPDDEMSDMKVVNSFTYQDLKKFTNVGINTVREYVGKLEEMGLLVVNRNKSPHAVMLPSNFNKEIETAFTNDVFSNYCGGADLDECEVGLKFEIQNIYDSFLERFNDSNFSKLSSEEYKNVLENKRKGEDDV